MALRRSHLTQPSPAERVRSILAVAHSMTVSADGLHREVHRFDGAGAMGHVHLHAPSEAGQTLQPTRVPARLEFADIAPTPVRERLRARLTLTGLLPAPYRADSAESTCMEFGQAVLEDDTGRWFVTLDALQAAEPDPIARHEADLLTHLTDSHGELVLMLLRLVKPQQRQRQRMVRAVPVAMDRYGLTLRLEYSGSHRDIRLPFPTPVADIEQATPQIHALLAAARRSSHPNRLLA